MWLAIAFLNGWMPYFTSRWHWDYGHPEIWGPVTGCMATIATAFINIYMMDVIIVCPKRRLIGMAMVTTGVILQYSLCWEMFVNAALPIHMIDLAVYAYALFCLVYSCWKNEKLIYDDI